MLVDILTSAFKALATLSQDCAWTCSKCWANTIVQQSTADDASYQVIRSDSHYSSARCAIVSRMEDSSHAPSPGILAPWPSRIR